MLDVTRAYGLDFLFPVGDTAVGLSLREHGEFARPEVDLICNLARGTFVDVGANIGAISLPVAAARPDLKVVAAEAHRGLSGLLAANTYGNHLANVEPHHVAVGRASGVAAFAMRPLRDIGNFGEGSLADPAAAPEEPVRMTTLDALAPDDTGFVKVDVEGFEPEVLAGAAVTLADRRPAWLVEVSKSRPAVTAEVQRVLTDAGYRLFWFFSPFSTPRRTKPQFRAQPLRGDLSFLALDGDPPFALPAVGGDWPSDVSEFPHLLDYGLRPAARAPQG